MELLLRVYMKFLNSTIKQGRASAEVTLLTAETLKMAKIAGLDYSKATDNMTVALNGFKIAASEGK